MDLNFLHIFKYKTDRTYIIYQSLRRRSESIFENEFQMHFNYTF